MEVLKTWQWPMAKRKWQRDTEWLRTNKKTKQQKKQRVRRQLSKTKCECFMHDWSDRHKWTERDDSVQCIHRVLFGGRNPVCQPARRRGHIPPCWLPALHSPNAVTSQTPPQLHHHHGIPVLADGTPWLAEIRSDLTREEKRLLNPSQV